MADFLDHNSWIDELYAGKLRGRYFTMRIALNLLYQQTNRNIVETGCVRRYDDYGNGNSTYIFGKFVTLYGGHLTTIDINPSFMSACIGITKEWENNITYICQDSLTAIPELKNPIDLLYLDSYDVPEVGDASEGQKHNLKEFKVAEPLLHQGSLILIDDNAMENGGKTKLTKEYLRENGYKLIFNGDQTLWIK